MSKVSSILCDNCGTNLVIDSMYPHRWTLQLSAIDTGINTSGTTYAVCCNPPITDTLHFCHKRCLKEWLEKNQ